MLDRDLAFLYGVETKALKQAVKRNPNRFPDDFMFELTQEEFKNWRSQIVTSKGDKMGLRYPPYAFTENGVAMLSSFLNSERAILVNIQIMRTFTRLREILGTHEELKRKIEQVEKKYDGQFKVVFEAIRQLMTPPETGNRKIGFKLKEKGTPGRPPEEWQPLEVHLKNVAEMARQFAEPFGAGEWGYRAGLWHDFGKGDKWIFMLTETRTRS